MLYSRNHPVLAPAIYLLILVLCCVTGQAQPTYKGTIRVYIVEETSRWHDAYGTPFTNGFLDWALVAEITASDDNPFVLDTVWDAGDAGYPSVMMSNVTVVAALFSDSCEIRDSCPPYNRLFEMCPVDAVAVAEVGGDGDSNHDGPCTHTILAEISVNTT